MSELRAMIEREAVSLEEVAERASVSVHTVRAWVRGAVPQGAPPFPTPVKVAGKILRLYCASECLAWIDVNGHRATPPA